MYEFWRELEWILAIETQMISDDPTPNPHANARHHIKNIKNIGY